MNFMTQFELFLMTSSKEVYHINRIQLREEELLNRRNKKKNLTDREQRENNVITSLRETQSMEAVEEIVEKEIEVSLEILKYLEF